MMVYDEASRSNSTTRLGNKMDRDEKIKLRMKVGQVFSPAVPITDRDLFAGRTAQLERLMEVVLRRGEHALIYGERGVGKTSLARVTQDMLGDTVLTSYYTCNSEDDFDTIWQGLFEDITFTAKTPGFGFSTEVQESVVSAGKLLAGEIGPRNVVRAAQLISRDLPLVVIIDEFDRPTSERTRTLMADTIKLLADGGVPATVVLVGVADTVEELIAKHESIQRPLTQVQMPRMTEDELRDIIHGGMSAVGLEVDEAFVDEVATLSQGFPHFAHLLGQHGAVRAISAGRAAVHEADFNDALEDALSQASQSVRERYHNATFSNRKTLYKEVLLACAMADKDDMGSFGAPDVREHLRKITDTDYDIPAFSAHLKDFSSEDGTRGRILQRIGTTRRFRYRFRDPLMPPYVVMKGRLDDLI